MVDSINFYNNVANLMDNAIEKTRKIIKELPKQETDGEVSVSPGIALTPKKGQKCDFAAKLGEPVSLRVFRCADRKSIMVTTEYSFKREITDAKFHAVKQSIDPPAKSNRQHSIRRV